MSINRAFDESGESDLLRDDNSHAKSMVSGLKILIERVNILERRVMQIEDALKELANVLGEIT